MESNFKVYKNILSNEIIDKLIHYANTSLNNFQDGKVRNHINLNQKISFFVYFSFLYYVFSFLYSFYLFSYHYVSYHYV